MFFFFTKKNIGYIGLQDEMHASLQRPLLRNAENICRIVTVTKAVVRPSTSRFAYVTCAWPSFRFAHHDYVLL